MGGHLKFHFFMGPEPSDVYKQISDVIGRPAMPPYWGLGFHMCRTETEEGKGTKAIEEMIGNDIPFESDCGSAAFSGQLLEQAPIDLSKTFKQNKIAPDHSIRALLVQVPYRKLDDKVVEWQSFLLQNDANPSKPFEGQFFDWWKNSDEKDNLTVVYPIYMDVGAKSTANLLEAELTKIYGISDEFDGIDGIFLDYNTPIDLTPNVSKTCATFLANHKWNEYNSIELNRYTPCLDFLYPNKLSHLSQHNLYGHQHMEQMRKAFTKYYTSSTIAKIKKRPLIMSLSTFMGSGRYGGHIGTNMNATWPMMAQTIFQTLEFNLYGIPLTGFPVCGFKGELPDDDLCIRWYQLAALQPFMISHRDFAQKLTDPIELFGDGNEKELDFIKSSIVIRYRLLPYLYTLFYGAYKTGEPVVRPLFYEFPADNKTHRIDKQYMWGPALMVTPVTEPNAKSVGAYFPKGIWYDYYSGRRISSKSGQSANLSAVMSNINLHVRGGHVIPTQLESNNTALSRKQNFVLIAALSQEDRKAEGTLYIDDGISPMPDDPTKDLPHLSATIVVTAYNSTKNDDNHNNTITITVEGDLTYKDEDPNSPLAMVDIIKVFGVIDPMDPPEFNITIGSGNPDTRNANTQETHRVAVECANRAKKIADKPYD
ncbi:unnamed protein product [Medioppia subpectinata]|uniref:Uncharacterized protein n=1 Tax=Medioppia subpectinata TaxID=1979941 RepID=A0A7R9KS10_9ACAR|nr:unnamed protein product [Medioppia subpectinata]CAG2107555.1 unnamed protein product [Medioppia subpectinata]